jgi:hypothetical protein
MIELGSSVGIGGEGSPMVSSRIRVASAVLGLTLSCRGARLAPRRTYATISKLGALKSMSRICIGPPS